MGAGGNNTPLVFDCEPMTLKIRSGCEGGGKGSLVQRNLSATLSTSNDQTLFVPAVFGIGSYNSEGMKSANPRAGIYEADTARTLDANGGNPACNQGGMAVVAFAANQMEGPAYGIGNGQPNQAVLPEQTGTLTCMHDQQAVCYSLDRAAFNQGENAQYDFSVQTEQSQTLVAKGPNAVAVDCRHDRLETISGTLVAKPSGGNGVQDNNPVLHNYIVRRLTPRECAKLQGFSPDWCAGLGTPSPTEEDVAFWSEVWETHRRIIGKSKKPKSNKQIVKWLKNPHSDAKEYAMWGNGINLQSGMFVLRGIVELHQETGV
jgi:DNA (cytosine-5)-methyltransferase 1